MHWASGSGILNVIALSGKPLNQKILHYCGTYLLNMVSSQKCEHYQIGKSSFPYN